MSPWIIFGFLIPGVIIFLLGRYIGNTGYVEILKQYDEKKQYNKEGLTNHVRKLMTWTGGITILISLGFGLMRVFTGDELFGSIFLIVYVILTLQYVVRLRLSCKKYEIKELS